MSWLVHLNPRKSLRAQISLTGAGVVLLLSAMISFYTTRLSVQQIEAEQGKAFVLRAKNALDVLDRGMFERSREIQNAASLDDISNPSIPLASKREILERLQASFNAYAWVGMCDVNGKGLVGTGKYLEGKNLSQRPWCTKGRSSNYIGDVHDALLLAKLLPNPGGQPFYLVDVAAPVIDRHGKLQGVLCGHIYWAWADEVLDSKKTPGRDIFLLSRDGKILSGTEHAWGDFSDLAPHTMQQIKAGKKEGYHLEQFADGKTYLVGYAASVGYREYGGLGWTAVVREDIATAFAPAKLLQQRILIAGGALGLLFAWLSWMMASRIARPIRNISIAAEKVAAGDLHYDAPLNQGDDEVAHLSRAIHDMAVSLTQEIRQRREAEDALNLTAKVYEHNTEAIVISDHHNRILMVNRAFCDITGYEQEDVIGKDPKILSSGIQPVEFYQAMWRTLENDDFWRGEIWNKRKNGEIFPEWLTITNVRDDNGVLTHHIAVFIDISERKKEEEHILHLANHDALCDLPNRNLLVDRVEQAISQAQRQQSKIALLFIDLDHFKNINDSLGHDIGDELLKQVAIRLKTCLRQADTLARLGGDEFIAVLNNISSGEEAVTVAQKIIESSADYFVVEGHQLHVTLSIGISIYPDDGKTELQLMRNADLALYRAKDTGRNRFAFYESEMTRRAVDRLHMENDLRKAIELQQLSLHYQPKVSVDSNDVVGMEALLRWMHPEQGFISPAVFIPVAEQTGLIDEIGDWVLHQAVLQQKNWQAQGYRIVPVAINLSAVQFRQAGLVKHIQNIVQEGGLLPGYIELELTESMLMGMSENCMELMTQLRDAGFYLELDDFGTGYSSLSRLKLLPLHTIKIDQSFVRDIATDPDDESIVNATAVLAHAMHMKVVVEGVETQAQLEFIKALKCEEYQGYLFSRPLPADEVVKYLAR